eukprot:TRINITY_DN16705_c0_g1_i1.p1 TRINITY_DN16705_c0_g1~~TRINITY_DN16705_c0_g1_i1.p1  ORF type:complete len:557 (+),score=67.36 TRINITY_DN16705_c0_g1_i1:239-1909(+)
MATFEGFGITASARTPVVQSGGGGDNSIFQALGDSPQFLDVQYQAGVVLLTSLAFFFPALSAWRASWMWHAWIFAMLAVINAAYHVCDTDFLTAFGIDVTCPPSAELVFTQAHQMWLCFSYLQMAFLILGPEDPQLHLGDKAALQGSRGVREAPFDVIVVSRLTPFALLAIFFSSDHADHNEMQWKAMVLMELLLVFGCIGFWLPRGRSAFDVLLRFKFWQRLLNHGGLPIMIQLWICCVTAFPECRAFHCLWQVVVASFSLAMLRAVLPDVAGPRSTLINVYDTSALNPTISQAVLCGPALTILPASLAGASYDWCNGGGWHMSTLWKATSCQPGGYFVAIVAVPLSASIVVAFYLIDATTCAKVPWTEFTRPLEFGDPRLDHRRRILGKRLGCTIGGASAGLGLVSALIMHSNGLGNLLCKLSHATACLGLVSAMIMTVLFSDPTSRGAEFRRIFTFFVCLPSLAIHITLMLMERSIAIWFVVPQAVFVISEQLTVLVFVLWPLTWVKELNEDGQRRQISAFTWPRTAWRFDAGLPARSTQEDEVKAPVNCGNI